MEYSAHQLEQFMQRAIDLAQMGMRGNSGGPFGAVIVCNGEIIAEAHNEVLDCNDPTAHAEVVAIRRACAVLNTFQLNDCILLTSCEPCPMCLGAIYWARPQAVYYACTKKDAAEIGFDDQFIYDELELPLENRKIPMRVLSRELALGNFEEWDKRVDKKVY